MYSGSVSGEQNPAQSRPSARAGYAPRRNRKLLTPAEERELGLEIVQGRIDLVRALCAHPPALRVIGRWYGLVASGKVEPGQLLDTYTAFRKRELSEIQSQANGLTTPQKAEIVQRAGQIVALIGSLGSAGKEHAERVSALHLALRMMPLLDRRLGRLADRCREVTAGSDVADISRASGKLDRAKKILVNSNQDLCRIIVSRYQNMGMDQDDLMQEANWGLSTAIDRFDAERNNRLGIFARHLMKERIQQAMIRQGRIICLPFKVYEDLVKLNKVKASLERRNEDVTPDLLARKTGLAPAKIKLLQEVPPAPLSLETPRTEDMTLGGSIVDLNAANPIQIIFESQLKQAINGVLKDLDSRELDVLTLRLGLDGREPHSVNIIAAQYSVPGQWIREIEQNTLTKIRRHQPLLAIFGRGNDGLKEAIEPAVSPFSLSRRAASVGWNDEAKRKRFEELWNDGSFTTRDIAEKLTKEFGQLVTKAALTTGRARLGLEARGKAPSSRRGASKPA